MQLRPKPDGDNDSDGDRETFILCRSADRAAKEQAIRERFALRIEAGLAKLVAACGRKRQTVGVAEHRVGRRCSRPQAACGKTRFYDVRVTDAGRRSIWSGPGVDDVWRQALRSATAATCCAATSPTGQPRNCGVRTRNQAEAEAAFRIHKDRLEMRPVWHQDSNSA